jgi:hypothetical protein
VAYRIVCSTDRLYPSDAGAFTDAAVSRTLERIFRSHPHGLQASNGRDLHDGHVNNNDLRHRRSRPEETIMDSNITYAMLPTNASRIGHYYQGRPNTMYLTRFGRLTAGAARPTRRA